MVFHSAMPINNNQMPNNNNPINQSAVDIENQGNNLEQNKEKFFFFKFLMYNSKIEMHLESFTLMIYWTSIIEMAVWLVGLSLFISSPSNFAVVWAMILHVGRGILGMFILKFLPNSYQVIDELKETENESIEAVQQKLLQSFIDLLKENEPRLKPLLMTYLCFSIADLIIDVILFLYLVITWGKAGYELMNIVGLAVIAIFFICDTQYLGWFGNLRFSFPYEMLGAIRKAAAGFLGEIANVIEGAFLNVYNKAKNKLTSSAPEGSQEGANNANQD